MVRINKVYTKSGDQGKTQLIGGDKVSKASERIGCYGTIDELNATIGMTLAALAGTGGEDVLVEKLLRIQNELFNVGTQLATPDAERRSTMPDISDAHVKNLEEEIDALNEDLPELKSFVLPGGSHASACFHLARTVCRRAERAVVALADDASVDARHLMYLNRLSDALFVFGRYSLFADKRPEVLWEPESV
jgi:cob(I)alamin adenosyltransferase